MPDANETQRLMELLRNAYPYGLRIDAENTDSVVYTYDAARAEVIQTYKELIDTAVARLLIGTADETGVAEWESMLSITPSASQSISVRKAEVVSRLLGQDTSIATIKSVLDTLVGEGEYTITELFRTSADPDDIWTYVVNLTATEEEIELFTSVKDQAVAILQKLHPAHCSVRYEVNPVVEDSMGLTDSVVTAKHEKFVWNSSQWAPSDDILAGDYWNPAP